MGRRRRFATQHDVDRYLTEKVSVDGDGPYRSGITIRDFNSFGICSRVYDPRAKRVQDFLSNGEYGYNDLVLFDQRVIKSEEQKPVLPISETHTLAMELGISHPRQGKALIPFRTDHYLTLRRTTRERLREIAIEVKEKRALSGKRSRRILEKKTLLEIYFEARGNAEYILAFKEDLDRRVIQNLRFLRYGLTQPLTSKAQRGLGEFAQQFSRDWSRRPKASLEELATDTGLILGFSRLSALQLFQVATWKRMIPVDVRSRVLPYLPLVRTDHPELGVTFPW